MERKVMVSLESREPGNECCTFVLLAWGIWVAVSRSHEPACYSLPYFVLVVFFWAAGKEGNGMDKVACLCQQDFSSSTSHEGKLVLMQNSHVTDKQTIPYKVKPQRPGLRVWYGLVPKRVGYSTVFNRQVFHLILDQWCKFHLHQYLWLQCCKSINIYD